MRELLQGAGIEVAEAPARGWDHGVFIPLKLVTPQADIPVAQLSLKAGLDPAEHLAAGRALAPLRDEGVLIVGSGMSWHNMRGFSPAFTDRSAAFDAWLAETVADPARREAALARWEAAPHAREAHPREEHLIPLMVAAGSWTWWSPPRNSEVKPGGRISPHCPGTAWLFRLGYSRRRCA